MTKYKPIFQSIFILVLSSLCFMVSVKGIRDQNMNLTQLNKFTGEVISTGVRTRFSKQNAKVFFVSLKGLPQTLGVYRMSRNYDDLLRNIAQSDVLTVYYRTDNSNEVNIDLVQIENDGKVLLDKKEFQKKEASMIWICLIGGFVLLSLSIYNCRKYFIPKNKNAA